MALHFTRDANAWFKPASPNQIHMEEGNFLEYEVCIVIGGLIGILDLVKCEAKYDF